MPLHPLGGGRDRVVFPLLLSGERGKGALAVPSSRGMDAYHPKPARRGVAHSREHGRVLMANYVAVFIPNSTILAFPFLHRQRRTSVDEEENGNVLGMEFTHHGPLRCTRVPSPASPGSSLHSGARHRTGGRGASLLVWPNQRVGRPLVGAPRCPLFS